MTPDGAGARLELAQPLTADYPENTSVRMHLISAPFLYVGANNKTLTDQWQELTGTVRGYRLWTGTRKIGIVVIVNATGDRNGVTQCRDLRLEETP